MNFAYVIPSPSEHCAIVLRSGVRFIGHTEPFNEFTDESVKINEGKSRCIEIDLVEIAAIERFPNSYSTQSMCEVCRELAGVSL